MPGTRGVKFLVYEGFEILDLAGPAAVFNAASRLHRPDAYDIQLLSTAGGTVSSGAGISMDTRRLSDVALSGNDTVLVVGGEREPVIAAVGDVELCAFLSRARGVVERYGSICTGAFVLAAAGVLTGRRATTHWIGCEQLGDLFSDVEVVADALYVNDGPVWTSAGVTTGIDMALALVESDHGRAVMGDIAKRLIVYAHRPGNQSQFSSLLDAQTRASDTFGDLIQWLGTQLDQSVKVSDMAKRAGMSERTFHRKFTQQVRQTPSKFLEHLRLEKAKLLIEAGEPIKSVTAAVGFRSEAGFRSAFDARYGLAPSVHGRIHGRPAA